MLKFNLRSKLESLFNRRLPPTQHVKWKLSWKRCWIAQSTAIIRISLVFTLSQWIQCSQFFLQHWSPSPFLLLGNRWGCWACISALGCRKNTIWMCTDDLAEIKDIYVQFLCMIQFYYLLHTISSNPFPHFYLLYN